MPLVTFGGAPRVNCLSNPLAGNPFVNAVAQLGDMAKTENAMLEQIQILHAQIQKQGEQVVFAGRIAERQALAIGQAMEYMEMVRHRNFNRIAGPDGAMVDGILSHSFPGGKKLSDLEKQFHAYLRPLAEQESS